MLAWMRSKVGAAAEATGEMSDRSILVDPEPQLMMT